MTDVTDKVIELVCDDPSGLDGGLLEAQKLIDKYDLDLTVDGILYEFGGCCNVGIDAGGLCRECREHCV